MQKLPSVGLVKSHRARGIVIDKSEISACILSREVIHQAIKDLCGRDRANKSSAITYICSPVFSSDCENAGYPPALVDALKELVLLSKTERKYLRREIMKLLKEKWNG